MNGIILVSLLIVETFSVYVDGQIDGSLTLLASSIPLDADDIIVGARGDLTQFWNGSIDEVRMWNRSLTATEITQEYFSNLNKYDQDKWALFVNQSQNATDGLVDSNYSYYSHVRNNDGRSNVTETWFINVNTTPTNFPNINFTMPPTPVNDTTTSNTSILINVSITNSLILNELIWNWNGTNYSMFNDTLIGMWNLDNVSALGENGTNESIVFDASNYGFNGTVINAVVNSTDCVYGNCYTFDGSGDYIDMGNVDVIANATSFSVTGWMKQASSSTWRFVQKRGTGGAPGPPGFQISGGTNASNTFVITSNDSISLTKQSPSPSKL